MDILQELAPHVAIVAMFLYHLTKRDQQATELALATTAVIVDVHKSLTALTTTIAINTPDETHGTTVETPPPQTAYSKIITAVVCTLAIPPTAAAAPPETTVYLQHHAITCIGYHHGSTILTTDPPHPADRICVPMAGHKWPAYYWRTQNGIRYYTSDIPMVPTANPPAATPAPICRPIFRPIVKHQTTTIKTTLSQSNLAAIAKLLQNQRTPETPVSNTITVSLRLRQKEEND